MLTGRVLDHAGGVFVGSFFYSIELVCEVRLS